MPSALIGFKLGYTFSYNIQAQEQHAKEWGGGGGL